MSIRRAKRESVPGDHHRARRALDLEDQQFVSIQRTNHAAWLGWDQPIARHRDHLLDDVGGVTVTCDLGIVLDAKDHEATIGVREARNLLRDLIAHFATIARTLLSRWAGVHRLQVVVLALLGPDQLAEACVRDRHDLPSHSWARTGS